MRYRINMRISAMKIDFKSEYKSKVIALAKKYIIEMQPFVLEEQRENDDIMGNIELDQSDIAGVIDEYFEQGFTVEKVLNESKKTPDLTIALPLSITSDIQT